MKQTITMNEEQFHRFLKNIVNETINSQEIDEGLWDQVKTGAKTFFNPKKDSNNTTNDGRVDLSNRFNNAKNNFQLRGQYDNMNDLRNKLIELINNRNISPETTIGQLIGGKYNNNRYGTMNGITSNQMSQMRRNGLK